MALNVGSAYSFTPTATGPTGTALVFSVQNKPVWAVFNTASGALTGTPTAANVGTYTGIVISVSDGKASASLTAFNLTVTQVSNGSATLDWTPPTENTDGSALANLAGYNIYYGTSPDSLTLSVKVTNPGLTAYTLTDLAPGTWYFAVTSYSSAGAESVRTGMLSTTL
jgi:Fibronectin type III domain